MPDSTFEHNVNLHKVDGDNCYRFFPAMGVFEYQITLLHAAAGCIRPGNNQFAPHNTNVGHDR